MQNPDPVKAQTKSAIPLEKSTVQADMRTEVMVLGAGPGGYAAAFRSADLGKRVVLIERFPILGGVCLNVGCIPSKALLHVARVMTEVDELRHQGVDFGTPKLDLERLRTWKQSVLDKLTKGLAMLAKQRRVQIVHGNARFISPNLVEVQTTNGVQTISFENAIIATGSHPVRFSNFPNDDPRLIDSTGALMLQDIPQRLLVIGGGIIGLEMACVYKALGSKITVVELMDSLIPGADQDLVKPLQQRIEKHYEGIFLKTKVSKIEPQSQGLRVVYEGENAPEPQLYQKILLATGRAPNGKLIGAENAGVNVNDRGFISVDNQQRTNIQHIFAIGDIAGEPMLAHKATYEGKIAAEVIAGHKVAFDALTIPSVVYTDPEIAWMGLTETQAKARNIAYEKTSFPWAASGRALSTGRSEGMTKLLFEPDSKKLLGAGMVGINAGELIAEAVLALEMDANAEDISLTIHPHPTLSETIFLAAEMAQGTITDLYVPKK